MYVYEHVHVCEQLCVYAHMHVCEQSCMCMNMCMCVSYTAHLLKGEDWITTAHFCCPLLSWLTVEL